MKPYIFFDHTADTLFEAYGKSEEELFNHAALALESVQVDLKSVSKKKQILIKITSDSLDNLLFNFLQELLFLKDSKQLVFSEFNIKITKKRKYFLVAQCKGEEINHKKHKLGVDIKAITFHQFEVKQEKTYWKARILVDI